MLAKAASFSRKASASEEPAPLMEKSSSSMGGKKFGRLLSFSKKGQKKSTAALVENAVRAPTPHTPEMQQSAKRLSAAAVGGEYDAAISAMDEAAAIAAAEAEAAEKQKAAEKAEAAAAAAAEEAARAEEEAAAAKAKAESTAWVNSINEGWKEWTSSREVNAPETEAAAGSAATDTQEARLVADTSRGKSGLKAWLARHQGLLLLALLLAAALVVGLWHVLQEVPPPPPPPLLKAHEKALQGLVDCAKKVPEVAQKAPARVYVELGRTMARRPDLLWLAGSLGSWLRRALGTGCARAQRGRAVRPCGPDGVVDRAAVLALPWPAVCSAHVLSCPRTLSPAPFQVVKALLKVFKVQRD